MEAYLDWQKKSGGIKLNDVIEDYKYVAAGKTIKAGDLVEYINGVASRVDYGESVDTQLSTETYAGYTISAVQLDENRVFIAHSYGSNYQLYGIVCTINGATITYGTDTQLSDVGYTGKTISLQLLPNGNVFIAHSWYSTTMYLYGMVVSINDTTIAKGSDTAIKDSTSYSGYSISTCLLPNGNVFIAHSNGTNYNLYGIVVSISGTTITAGTDTAISTSNRSGSIISTCLLPNGNVFIAHSYDSSNYYLYGIVCSISGTTITAGSDTAIENVLGKIYSISTCLLPNGNVFIAHSCGSDYHLYGVVVKINDKTITKGADTALLTGSVNEGYRLSAITLDNDRVLIIHTYSTGYRLYGLICNISDTTITKGTDTEIGSSGNLGDTAIYSILLQNGSIFAAYSYTNSYKLNAQIFAIDYDNNIPTNNIVITEYEQQVTPATEPPFNAIALSSGEGAEFIEQEVEVEKTGNIFPTSWTKETATKYTASDGTILSASTVVNNDGYPLSNCCDGNTSTHTSSGELSYTGSVYLWRVTIELPTAIKISKMNTTWSVTNGSKFNRFYVKGSKDGSAWNNLYSTTVTTSDSKEHNLSTSSNFDSYKYYQLYWEWSASGGTVNIYDWQTSEYVEKEMQLIPPTEHKDQVKIARVAVGLKAINGKFISDINGKLIVPKGGNE